jgi:hypothetical protein
VSGEGAKGWKEVAGWERGLWGGGWQAHSVRRESCNSDSSPEPAAACSERGNPVRGWGDFGWWPGVSLRATPGY